MMLNQINTTAITGIGYVTKKSCGAIAKKVSWPSLEPRQSCRILKEQGIIKDQSKNFGRFDHATLLTYASSLLACMDAGIAWDENKQRIGIVGSNQDGSLESNKIYFSDYIAADRSGARSHLFIYTLPTTPIAEVSLFCGFTGPLIYTTSMQGGILEAFDMANMLVEENNTQAMLCTCHDDSSAITLVLTQKLSLTPMISCEEFRQYAKEAKIEFILNKLGIF